MTFSCSSKIIAAGLIAVMTAAGLLVLTQPAKAATGAVFDVFSQNLKFGARNRQVLLLQALLTQETGIYPEGMITGYFGARTLAAVKRFQRKYASEILTPAGLKASTGYVGPRTRAKLNQLYLKNPPKIVLPEEFRR